MIWLAQQIAALLVIIFGGWVLLKLATNIFRRLHRMFNAIGHQLAPMRSYGWMILAGMILSGAVIYSLHR